MNTIYDQFGVVPLVNACGPKTCLGGALMEPEVVEAASLAALHSVDMAELQAAACRVIAGITGAEAGYVSAGAASGLTLAAAACMTGHDPARIDRLPDTSGMPSEIIMLRAQRNSYDHALRASGARIVDVGLNDRGVSAGLRGVDPWEIEAAISERTAAIAFVAGHEGDITLEEVVAVAHRHNLPVIVDAAAQLPPVENLRRFVASGADLVVFSGGKAIGGPQATGVMCGRRALIQAVALNHLDWDIDLGLWRMPAEFRPEGLKALPRHGIGRGFKVSKENIVALLVALQRFAAGAGAGEERAGARRAAMADAIAAAAARIEGVRPRLSQKRGFPAVELDCGTPERARGLYLHLYYGNPRVAVDGGRLRDGILVLSTACLKPGDEQKIAAALGGWNG